MTLILYLHRQVNGRESWIKWLRLWRRERVASIRRATLLECPRLESTLTRLVSGRVQLRRGIWSATRVKGQIQVIKEVVLVFTIEKIRQNVRLSLVINLSCLLL